MLNIAKTDAQIDAHKEEREQVKVRQKWRRNEKYMPGL